MAHNIDEDLSDDDDDDIEVNMDMGHSKKKTFKRVYDSKFKIPLSKKVALPSGMNRQATVFRASAMMNAAAKIQGEMLVYKRCANTFTTLLMGGSSICMILLYLYLFSSLIQTPYYITRASVAVP